MQHNEANDMSARPDDSPNMRPTRVVTTWGAFLASLPLLTAVGGTGLLMWKTQGEESRETKLQLQFMTNAIQDMKAEVKATGAQMSAKSERDAKQDQQILDIERRVTRIEAR